MASLVRKAASNRAFRDSVAGFGSPATVDTWVRSVFNYMEEPYEIVLSPDLVLHIIQTNGSFVGDCDDVSTFEAAIFTSMGIPTKFVAIKAEADSDEFTHVFTQIQVGGQWYSFDATVPVQGVGHYPEHGRMEVMI